MTSRRVAGVVFDGEQVVEYRRTGGRPMRILNHYAVIWRVIGGHCAAQDYDVDVLYIRHPGANPALLGFLAWMKNRNPKRRIVLELRSSPAMQHSAGFSSSSWITWSRLALTPRSTASRASAARTESM